MWRIIGVIIIVSNIALVGLVLLEIRKIWSSAKNNENSQTRVWKVEDLS